MPWTEWWHSSVVYRRCTERCLDECVGFMQFGLSPEERGRYGSEVKKGTGQDWKQRGEVVRQRGTKRRRNHSIVRLIRRGRKERRNNTVEGETQIITRKNGETRERKESKIQGERK